MATPNSVTLVDYLVLAGAIACSLIAGLYYAYKERNNHSSYRYHRGEGKLKVLPVALSLLVTFESSIFFLGVPAEAYVHGGHFWMNSIALVMGFLGIYWISIPLFFPLQVTSIYEYLERRHGSKFLRQMATVLSSISLVIYSGLVLFGVSVALEPVTDIKKEITVVALVLIAVAYTSLGGIKSVVVTDVIQAVLMVVGIFAVTINGIVQVGGFAQVIAVNKASGRLNLVNFDINPLTRHTVWGFIFGGSCRTIAYCFKQPTVQRLNSTKSISDAKKVAVIAMIGFFVLDIVVVLEGLVAYAYFSHKGCDPLASGQISNSNQIMPYTVLDMFSNVPGLAGLYLAAICSASLSTVSSLLGGISAIISEDFIKERYITITDKKLTTISKVIVPLSGLASIGIALLVGGVKGPITQISLSILGAVDAPLVCIFVMSIFVKFSTKKGLLTGAFVGFALALWLSSGYNFSPGRKKTPWLPLGPTDRCETDAVLGPIVAGANVTIPMSGYNHEASVPHPIDANTTSSTVVNAQVVFANMSTVTSMPNYAALTPSFMNNSTASIEVPTSLHGLDYLYSISYLYFSLIVLLVSSLMATIVSKCTQPSKPTPVPPELMLGCSCRPFCRSSSYSCQPDGVDMNVKEASAEGELKTPLAESIH